MKKALNNIRKSLKGKSCSSTPSKTSSSEQQEESSMEFDKPIVSFSKTVLSPSLSHQTQHSADTQSTTTGYSGGSDGSASGGVGGTTILMEGHEHAPISSLVNMRRRRRWEIHNSIIEAVGQTPIVRLQRVPRLPKGVELYVKCENANPAGSLKDRLAMGIIEWAEIHGKITPGQTVVEASSGNTGVGMAMVCAAKGYPFVCVMSEAFSIERRKLMRFLGARVVLTPKANKATGMVIKAQELATKHGFFYAQQFENEANAWIHEQTTGPEIVKAFDKCGKKLDHFFMAYGTGGTVLGVSRAFRKAGLSTKIHLCEPSNAPMVTSGIPTKYPAELGETNDDNGGVESGPLSTAFETAHPVWSPHLMQGWATDFIPKLLSQAKEEGAFEDVYQVSGPEAIAASQRLAREEAIFTGISGGGILAAATRLAQRSPPGTTILAILPDTGERYLSTALFQDIPVDMTEEELLLSDSTPSNPPPPPPPLTGVLPADTDQLFDL